MKKTMMMLFAVLCSAATPTVFGAVRGESTPVMIDTVTIANLVTSPLVESMTLSLWWGAAWIGGNANATVVIKDNGTEVKRATGTGDRKSVV